VPGRAASFPTFVRYVCSYRDHPVTKGLENGL
jgi:hypothetical protein